MGSTNTNEKKLVQDLKEEKINKKPSKNIVVKEEIESN